MLASIVVAMRGFIIFSALMSSMSSTATMVFLDISLVWCYGLAPCILEF